MSMPNDSIHATQASKINFWPWLKLLLGVAVVTYVLKTKLIDFESLKEVAFAPTTAGPWPVRTCRNLLRWFRRGANLASS